MADRYYVTDTALSDRFPIYTRANVGEVFPDPVTPLSSTSALWPAEVGWRQAWERMGAFELSEFPADEFCQLGVVGGYCYLNASLIRLFGERAPGLSWQDMDAQFFGAQPGIPPYEARPGDRSDAAEAAIGATFGWALSLADVDDLLELTEHRSETIELAKNRPSLRDLSDRQLLERYTSIVPVHQKLFCQHILTTYMATVPVGIISAVATAVGRPDLVLPIIAGLGDVDSAVPSVALWELSRLPADSAEFEAGFETFLAEFGSRGPNEWESRSPTWGTRPALAHSAIDRMRAAPDSMAPAAQHAARAAEREAASAELLETVAGDPATQGQLAAAIASSAAWLPGRERSKTNNIRAIHEMRLAMRELGARLVERGIFQEIEDFGFVTIDEYEEHLEDLSVLRDEIQSRRQAYQRLEELDPPFVFVGDPDSPDTWAKRSDVRYELLGPGDTLAGMPGCSGAVEGRARVVLDSNDPSALEPGDILVAPITDPSWTPLFVPAGAVVVDVGAPLSHAIIVSRELGIPCVISATGATKRIPDGAWIRVDGSTGLVTVIEPPT